MKPQPTHQKLWIKMKQGDRDAFSLLFQLNYLDLYNYGLKLCNNASMVKNEIQELFYVLWASKEMLSEVRFVQSYLFKCLRRRIIMRLISANSKRLVPLEENQCIDITNSPEEYIINKEIDTELKSQLFTVLNKLPKRQQEAIYLKYILELDYDTISKIMNIKYQTLRNTIHNGISSLRGILKPYYRNPSAAYTPSN